MISFDSRELRIDGGSHLPVLVKLILMTDGSVLELGTGFYSTPIIHWLCAEKKRKIVSYEPHDKYVEVAKNCLSDFHEVHQVNDWSKIDIESQHWSIVFVDHGPAEQRKVEMIRVANNADYVIAHDSEPRGDRNYHYSKVTPFYKYRYDYDKLFPHTSVFSNFKDLSKL